VQISEIILIHKIFYSFLRLVAKKRTKRRDTDCTSAAKIASLLPKRCKTTPFGALIGAALLTVKTRNLFTLLQ
jgi:hypothetical protein